MLAELRRPRRPIVEYCFADDDAWHVMLGRDGETLRKRSPPVTVNSAPFSPASATPYQPAFRSSAMAMRGNGKTSTVITQRTGGGMNLKRFLAISCAVFTASPEPVLVLGLLLYVAVL